MILLPLYCRRDGHSWFRANGKSQLPTISIDNGVLLSFLFSHNVFHYSSGNNAFILPHEDIQTDALTASETYMFQLLFTYLLAYLPYLTQYLGINQCLCSREILVCSALLTWKRKIPWKGVTHSVTCQTDCSCAECFLSYPPM